MRFRVVVVDIHVGKGESYGDFFFVEKLRRRSWFR
jgi:hypothetical protein